jgi:hypothetical protein
VLFGGDLAGIEHCPKFGEVEDRGTPLGWSVGRHPSADAHEEKEDHECGEQAAAGPECVDIHDWVLSSRGGGRMHLPYMTFGAHWSFFISVPHSGQRSGVARRS